MVADLPLIWAPGHPSLGPVGPQHILSPSQYHRYFPRYYEGLDGGIDVDLGRELGPGPSPVPYGERLNSDRALLASGEAFLRGAQVVGLTEALGPTMAMVLFSFPAGKEQFFEWRPDRDSTADQTGSLGAGAGAAEEQGAGGAGGRAGGRAEGRLCWGLRARGLGAEGRDKGSGPVLAMRHDRQDSTHGPPSAEDSAAIGVRNALDLRLYASAQARFEAIRTEHRLCRA